MSRKPNNRFFDHDDRGSGSNHNMRKVTFKSYHGRINKPRKVDKGRERFYARLKVDDDDIDMAGCEIQGYKINKRRNFKGRPRSPSFKQNTLRASDYYKVRIAFGAKYEKNNLLQLLLKYLSPYVFVPISYTVSGNCSFFYVDNLEAAKMLGSANRKIKLPDGHMISISVQEAQIPPINVNDELKEKIKCAMAKRYVAENKALNLSKFSNDPEFTSGIYCTLARPQVLRAVMQIINEHIPDLYALDLTGNKIQTIDRGTSVEFQKMKGLRILHLGDNSKSWRCLICLTDSNEIGLFHSEVRKRFPKLTKLDDAELPPVVSFDVAEESKLPAAQASFICNPDGRAIVREFLSQYFALYDSDKRMDLIQAYHRESHFSFCSFYNPNQNASTPNRLNNYMQENRNLFKVTDYLRRRARLHMGNENIVKQLKELPKTQHDLSSFVVDLTLFTPALINLSVCGVFREPDATVESSWPVRHFSRTFLIVRAGEGFCIINDSLFIRNATDSEKAASFKVESVSTTILQSPSSQVTSAPQALDDSVKLQMVQTLAAQSGMNLEWSKKCLDETQWNFERAVWTFTELQKQGTIPPEAFVKCQGFGNMT